MKGWDWPVLLRRFHGWSTLGWVVMVPISIWTGWWHDVGYVTLLSLWALVLSQGACWQASRAEVASVTNPPQGTSEDGAG